MKKNTLFVTRTYPPQVGGMEQYSYDLYHTLAKNAPVTLMANKQGKKFLPFFLAQTAWYLLWNRKQFSQIHFGDGVLSMLVPLAKTEKNHVSITAHGLDVIYENKLYQLMIKTFLKKADAVICVSSYTKQQCVRRGVPASKCVVIPNGIRFDSLKPAGLSFATFQKHHKLHLEGKNVLVSVSRLVRRKGHAWFVTNVIPALSPEYVLVIGGTGPEYEAIHAAAAAAGVGDRVFLLGRISDEEKRCLYAHGYAFIMPNIRVRGDVEGFGISLIEAAAHGLPSVAAKAEGITDAVIERKTGFLVEENVPAYVRAIKRARTLNKASVRKSARVFDWNDIVKQYMAVFHE